MDRRKITRRIEKMEDSECLSAADYALLRRWAEHPDALIRDLVASVLVFGEKPQGQALLLALTEDPDELVRADAYDSLSVYPDAQVAEKLKQAAAEEPDELARYFAIAAYADVALETERDTAAQKKFFCALRQRETASVCRLGCDYALYQLGEPGALKRILGYLDDPDYIVRCRAVCTLEEIANEGNQGEIMAAVRARRSSETSAAVRERMDAWLGQK